MELKYDLPQPDIRYRARKYLDDLRAGDVVAYRMIDYGGHHTEGVMVIGDFNMFWLPLIGIVTENCGIMT